MASREDTPYDDMLQAVRGVLTDFSRRVRQAHSFDEIEAHRDELADLIVGLVSTPRLNATPHASERLLTD